MTNILTFPAKVLALFVCLVLSNPIREEVTQHSLQPRGFVSDLVANVIGATYGKLWAAQNTYNNLGLLSLIKTRRNAYYVGILGFWIDPAFWSTIPAIVLAALLLWQILYDYRVIRKCWLELVALTLFYVYIMQHMLSSTLQADQMGIFFAVISVSTLVLMYFILLPLRFFHQKHPLNSIAIIYALASAAIAYCASTDFNSSTNKMRWLAMDINISQVALSIVLAQFLNGHVVGVAGSLSGGVLSALNRHHSVIAR